MPSDYNQLDDWVAQMFQPSKKPWWKGFMDERGKPTRILLVEDEPGQAQLVHLFLEFSPACSGGTWDIVDAPTVDLACGLLSRECFDCVLLDLGMPVYSDLQVVTNVMKCCTRTPVIVMSNNVDDDVYDYCMSLGVVMFIPKTSVGPEDLQHCICDAIDLFETQQGLRRLSVNYEAHAETARNQPGSGNTGC